MNQSYEWVEKLVAFEPHLGHWQSAVRNGLLEVGVVPFNGFTFDHINGTKVGGTIFDEQGNRHTAADLLEYANPRGLTVLLYATVQKILFRFRGTLSNNTAQMVKFYIYHTTKPLCPISNNREKKQTRGIWCDFQRWIRD